ncbi:MAG: DUF1800 domain-containing protein [Phycisphaerales bacterium]|nr:DUF1800 domain-containing protein [Phycisphaerales bacterium]MCB9854174.1 DUF1800 domain-containing protein [Phycisphaerales bacterium]MCB9864690.1 DUF1800 domain-containing protein [Phycisphaerales bacterium]
MAVATIFEKLTRRRFMGAVGATACVAAGCATGVDPVDLVTGPTEPGDKGTGPDGPDTTTTTTVTPGVEPETPPSPPSPPAEVDYKNLLLARTTFGPIEFERALYDQLGHEGYVEYQLAWDDIDDSGMDARLASLDLLDEPPANLISTSTDEITRQLQTNMLVRAIHSRRQLYERMCEFWTDHFYVHAQRDVSNQQLIENDRDNIRPNALGTFGDLLHAVVRGPALLTYLNNGNSRIGVTNENFARELLELHTVGVDGGYAQRDVVDLSRVLTGWNAVLTNFAWHSGYHDQGAKQVMDVSLAANGGINDIYTVVDYLAAHPNTAEFIATKLVRRFISEDVPSAVVNSVKQAFIDSDGDIKSVLRVLFSRASLAHATPKLKRPFHLIASLMRQSGAETDAATDLMEPLYLLGHAPYEWHDPDGYPDVSTHWAGGMMARWRVSQEIANGLMSAYTIPDTTMETSKPNSKVAEKIAAWNTRYFGGALTSSEKGLLTSFATNFPHQRELFATMVNMPSFQLH